MPAPYENVDEFLRAVEAKADAAGKKAVLAMSRTGKSTHTYKHLTHT